uniref:Uncharacterized protein n=1 Tax=Rhizophora mucronata TaxID=61149 RepID=A0A2P2QLA3_RHIMU
MNSEDHRMISSQRRARISDPCRKIFSQTRNPQFPTVSPCTAAQSASPSAMWLLTSSHRSSASLASAFVSISAISC